MRRSRHDRCRKEAHLPNIESIIVEVPALAVMANAIEDATGIRLTVLPLTPERVALAIAEGQTAKS